MHLSAKPSPKRVIPTSPLEDYQVDRPAVQAWRHVQLTGTNRTIDLTTFLHAAGASPAFAASEVRCREQGRLGPCGLVGAVHLLPVRDRVRSVRCSALARVLESTPGAHGCLAIPVPIPNTVVKQAPPMILRKRESRLSPGFFRARSFGCGRFCWCLEGCDDARGSESPTLVARAASTSRQGVGLSEKLRMRGAGSSPNGAAGLRASARACPTPRRKPRTATSAYGLAAVPMACPSE